MFKQNLGLCSECFESISNPICFSCLEREVNSWLQDKDAHIRKAVKIELKKVRNTTKDIGQTTSCILCGKNADVCPFCFAQDIKRMLSRKITAENFMDFELIFNFSGFGGYYQHEKDK